MHAEILSVGTELLLGQIVNTNAAYLSRRLSEIGIDLFRQVAVGDNLERIRAALLEALERAEVVVITGGLGPTADDLTAQAIAAALGRDLVLDEESAARIRCLLQSRGVTLLESHLKQARVPAGARILPNPIGTAPGFIVERDGRVVCALPGVPCEMEAIVEQSLLPQLRQRAPAATIRSRVLRFIGIGESALEALIADLVAAQSNPTIAPLAQMGEVHLRLTAKAPDPAEADRMLDRLEAAVRERAGDYIYGRDEDSLEAALGQRLRAANLTIGAAESCTGGLIGHRITQVPGSSDYFLGSVVAYSNAAKIALLGVPQQALAEHGAVSEAVALAMASGARRTLGCALAVSTTGIAGPGGATPGKPIGLTYVGFSGPSGDKCEKHLLAGSRDMIKWRAAGAALALALREAERLAGARTENRE